jgi:predicted ATP-dependent Lon-type protease
MAIKVSLNKIAVMKAIRDGHSKCPETGKNFILVEKMNNGPEIESAIIADGNRFYRLFIRWIGEFPLRQTVDCDEVFPHTKIVYRDVPEK